MTLWELSNAYTKKRAFKPSSRATSTTSTPPCLEGCLQKTRRRVDNAALGPSLNLIPGSRYRKRIMEMEQSTGIKAILSCIDQRYFTEPWLGRQIDRKCIEDMKPLVGPPGKGIDVSGEPGEYHSTTLDAPLFKERIEITKYTKKSRVVDFGGSPFREGNFLYMDIEEAVLKPKNQAASAES